MRVCPFHWQYEQNFVIFCLDLLFAFAGREQDWLTWVTCCSLNIAVNSLFCCSREWSLVFWSVVALGTSSELIVYITSMDVIWVWKAFQIAFGCSIRYSWAFLFSPFDLSPLTVNSMCLAFLWFCCYLFRPASHLELVAILCRLRFWLCDENFWLIFYRLVHISLLWFCVCICLGHLKIGRWKWFWSGPKLLRRLSSLHTILLPVLDEMRKIGLSFWMDSVLVQPRQLVVIQVRNWLCFQLWVEMILRPDQDRYQKICLGHVRKWYCVLCYRQECVVSGMSDFRRMLLVSFK